MEPLTEKTAGQNRIRTSTRCNTCQTNVTRPGHHHLGGPPAKGQMLAELVADSIGERPLFNVVDDHEDQTRPTDGGGTDSPQGLSLRTWFNALRMVCARHGLPFNEGSATYVAQLAAGKRPPVGLMIVAIALEFGCGLATRYVTHVNSLSGRSMALVRRQSPSVAQGRLVSA